MLVERRQRLAEEDGVVGEPRIGRDRPAPGDLEVQPPAGALRAVERAGQAPRSAGRGMTLADVGDSHGGSLAAARACDYHRRMFRAQHRRLENPNEVRTFPFGRVEIYEIGDVVVGRQVFEPGWRWSLHIQPIAGTSHCEYHHMGYVISGAMRIVLEDGTSYDVGPNEAYEIPPRHDAWVLGDQTWISLDWAGMRSFARPVESRGERTLATILFTDLVDSTAAAAKAGDGVWRDMLARHNQVVRFELDRFRGREIHTTGDGFLAIFDGAERAVRCAAAISLAVRALGLSTRAGLHTGEVEFVTGDVRGIAVHAAARVMALAGPGEVLVSGTTHELLEGSGLAFEDRGLHELKGITGARQVFALAQ